MTYYLRSGSVFRVSTKEALDLHETLPAGTYTVKFDQMSGQFFLDTIDNFDVKGKIYGDTMKQAERILATFQDRDNSTGVMLTGDKGSGKTLLAKVLSVEAMKQEIPTIVINMPWVGEGFNSFLQMIEQPTIIIFDEFEKVYDKDDQEQMLTLLDGVYPSKKLFVLTCNDKYRVNEHMRNRPGRIFYRLDYFGLEAAFIKEYCEDNLKNKAYIDSVANVSLMFQSFNFDMLKALVEDMNRYDESPQEALKILNVKPESNDFSTYKIGLTTGNRVIPAEDLYDDDTWRGNPITQTIVVNYKTVLTPAKAKAEAKTNAQRQQRRHGGDISEWERDLLAEVASNPGFEYKEVTFEPDDLQLVDPNTGKFEYLNKDGDRLVLEKVYAQATYANWAAF